MESDQLKECAAEALAELKAQDVKVIDVRRMTSITDYMIFASGTSDRHVRGLAQSVVDAAKKNGVRPIGVEGEQRGEWVLVDLASVVVHVMLPRVREFYQLEKLWSVELAPAGAAAS